MRFDADFSEWFHSLLIEVDRGCPLGPCLEWSRSCTRAGYGQIQRRKISSQPLLAHRVAWELAYGDPGKAHVLHHCDNPPCCNVAQHLFLGDNVANAKDRDAKGRTASGEQNGARTRPERNPFVRSGGSGLSREAHPQAKLSEADVSWIRANYSGEFGQLKDFGNRFGVSSTQVLRVVQNKSWRSS
jgi:hypothetical protein